MSDRDDGNGGWSSRFLKVASAAVTTAAVAGGLYALLSSSASASSEHEVPFGARRESEERVNHEGAIMVRWEKPDIGWKKLNVDGSRDHYNGPSAGCGGVLRDASAKWICGFAQKLNPSNDVHQTELQAILIGLDLAWDILIGLDLAWDMKVKKLVVESDNDSVVSMVENGVKRNHPDYDTVQRIRMKRDHLDWELKFVSISNTANRVADRLAKDARNLPSYDLNVYYDPPPNCIQFLKRDETGYMSY